MKFFSSMLSASTNYDLILSYFDCLLFFNQLYNC